MQSFIFFRKIPLLFLLLVLSGPQLTAQDKTKVLVDKVVASVNDEIILLSELKNLQNRLKKPGAIDETILLGENMDSLKDDKKAQLGFLIREKLVESDIKRQGMSLSEEQTNAELSQMAKSNRLTLADFTSHLSAQGYKLEEYKEIIKARSERRTFFEKEIVSKLRISDEDAYGVFQSKYPNYRPNISEFKIAQIFFANKKGGSAAAHKRAEAAFMRLKAGEAFEVLANQLDEIPGGNKGGVLGVFKSGEFLPELERAVSSLAINTTTEIVRGPDGFHIVKLLEKKIIQDPQFLKVKEAIKASLVQQNFERQLKNWFELKKLEATIKIYDQNL